MDCSTLIHPDICRFPFSNIPGLSCVNSVDELSSLARWSVVHDARRVVSWEYKDAGIQKKVNATAV